MQHLSQANGVWAVLFSSSVGNSVIAGDSRGPAHAFLAAIDVEQLAVDEAGHIQLVHRCLRPSDARNVSVVDMLGNAVTEYSIPGGSAAHFLSSSGLLWKLPQALVGAHTAEDVKYAIRGLFILAVAKGST